MDKQAGLLRNPVAGSRVAIKGGGGKRITTPRRLQQSVEVSGSEKLAEVSIKGGAVNRIPKVSLQNLNRGYDNLL